MLPTADLNVASSRRGPVTELCTTSSSCIIMSAPTANIRDKGAINRHSCWSTTDNQRAMANLTLSPEFGTKLQRKYTQA